MYEFTDKEIRKQFKETEYGKKTNKWFIASVVVALVIIFVIPFIIGVVYGIRGYVIEDTLKELETFTDIYAYVILIAVISACYFDGKRDGAIEQFKRGFKK